MRAVRARLRQGALLALLSLWVLTLAPTLARWHAAMDPLAWVPVCTSQGLLQGQTAPDGSALPNPAQHLRGAESLFLSLQGTPPAIEAVEQAVALPTLPVDAPAATSIAVQHSASPWARAQARAPPAT
jgi:hypothetical protein